MGFLDKLSGKGDKFEADTGAAKQYYEEGRQNYRNEIEPIATQGTQAYNEIGYLLGVSGTQGQQRQSLQNFYNTPGRQYEQDQMTEATQRQFSATGMNQSGNVLAALQDRSQNLASTQFNTYLSQLGSYAQPGLTAKQNLADMEWAYASAMGNLELGAMNAEAQAYSSQSSGGGLLGGIGGLIQGLGGAQGISSMFSGITNLFGGGTGGGMGDIGTINTGADFAGFA